MAKKKASNKLCPDRQFFYEPTLKALDMLGGSGSNGEIYKKVLEITNLPKDAKEEASSPGKRVIDLMDGEELISKMAEYGIGLNEVKSYEIDEDFFNSLEEE